jgi:hypothetical protein
VFFSILMYLANSFERYQFWRQIERFYNRGDGAKALVRARVIPVLHWEHCPRMCFNSESLCAVSENSTGECQFFMIG